MEFELKDLVYIIGIVISTLVTFLGTRHKLKEYIRDKNDQLRDQIHELKLQLKEQKARDDLQQQVIDQIGKQMDGLIPQLLNELSNKSKSNG